RSRYPCLPTGRNDAITRGRESLKGRRWQGSELLGYLNRDFGVLRRIAIFVFGAALITNQQIQFPSACRGGAVGSFRNRAERQTQQQTFEVHLAFPEELVFHHAAFGYREGIEFRAVRETQHQTLAIEVIPFG